MAETFDASDDDAGVQGAIAERGFAVIREAATAAELVRARELLWDHLASVGWERRDPTTWTDASFPGEGKEQLRFAMAGVLEGTPHIAANWYTRTLPGVLRGFASAYGTDDIVTAFGPMVINRPASPAQRRRAGERAARLPLGRGLPPECLVSAHSLQRGRLCAPPLPPLPGPADACLRLQLAPTS